MNPTQDQLPPRPRLTWWRRGLFFFGIDTMSRERFLVHLRPRFFAIAGSVLLVVMGSMLGTAAYSTNPSFCRSCHIMEPYYVAWQNSKHKDVPCVDCHYPPGSPQTILWKKFQASAQVVKFVTRTYSSKPFAEVEDASCLRSGCHATRLLQGRVVSERGILFDHRPHLEGVRYGRHLRCASCHSQVVVGKHIEVTWDTCFLCHMKGKDTARGLDPLGGCQGCHLMPEKQVKVGNITYDHKAFLGEHQVPCQSCHQDALEGSGQVSKEHCMTCHNQPEKIARYDDLDFIHENHVNEHNTACFHCHEPMRHGVAAAGSKPLDLECGSCHSAMHELQRDLYRGIGARGVPEMPSPMYLANVDCVGCHLEKKSNGHGVAGEASKTYEGTERGCVACHGPEYAGMLSETNAVMLAAEERLADNLVKIQAAHERAPGDDEAAKAKLGDRLKDAGYNLSFVKEARSIHNPYFAAQVLRATDRELSEAAKALGAKVAPTDDLAILNGSFCATLCHQRLGLKVPPETLEYDGNEMPHMEHVTKSGIACTECHTFGTHKEVKVVKEKLCDECH